MGGVNVSPPPSANPAPAGSSAAAARGRLHKWFDLGVWFKGVEGAFEILAGAWLAYDPEIVHGVLFRLAAKELLHDPHDRIAGILRSIAEDFDAGGHTFATLYLVAHGVVKVVLAIGLLRNRPWAYPFAIVTLSALAFYQLYRYTHTHSLMLPVLATLDLAIAWLVWRESRNRSPAGGGAVQVP